jgi:hypothetical protein
MFKCVLKTLSDTELVAIASELTNKKVKIQSIVGQLSSKTNSPIAFIGQISDVKSILISEVLIELSFRLLELNKIKVVE